MAKKFYAVRVGRKPGVYKSWSECESQVKQYPGAVFKGFEDEDSANNFVKGVEENNSTHVALEGVVAYVDGSFDLETNRYSYGVIIIDGANEKHFSGIGDDEEMAKMRNVAGEILGAMAAMRYARDNGIKEITILHDYQGISEWAEGRWATNKEGTNGYRVFCEEIAKSVKVKFQKVVGHSGNFYNDVADALAKRALGIKIKASIEDYILAVADTD